MALLRLRTGGECRNLDIDRTPMYNAAVAALETAPQRWRLATALWGECSRMINTTNAVATAMKSTMLWEEALSVYVRSESLGMQLDVVSHNILLASFAAECCTWTRILAQWARRFDLQDIVSLNSGLSTLGSKAQWGSCLLLLRDSPSERVEMDSFATTSAIAALRDCRWRLSLEFLVNSKAAEDLSIRTCNSAIATTQRQLAWHCSLQLFEMLRQTSQQPNLVSFNSLLTGEGSAGRFWRWEAAIQTFETGSELGVDLFTLASLSAILQGFARWEQALQLVQAHGVAGTAASQDSQQDASSAPMLQATLGASERARCWERTLDLLWWTKAFGLETVASHAAAASALSDGRQWRLALGCMYLAPARVLVATNAAITAHARGRKWTLAIETLQSLALLKLEADSFTGTSAISACEEAQWEFGLQILSAKSLHSRHVWCQTWPLLNAAVSMFGSGRTWRHPVELLTSLPLTGLDSEECRPGVAAALLVLAEEGQWPVALQLLEQLSVRRLQTCFSSCGPLLTYCEQQGLAGQEASLQLAFELGMEVETKLAAELAGKNVVLSSSNPACRRFHVGSLGAISICTSYACCCLSCSRRRSPPLKWRGRKRA
ncbi:unnamed protein product [Durusdinium trenchii]|uniref:Pentatricopeptide repeat-containing protein, chloroplastic n=2 Tax=Durusdinium trenchii TaxID=1381693 RepID=A0ABP0PL01_9DINO